MTPFYRTPERVEAFLAEAKSWLGTPFQARQRAKGAGVDCANLQQACHQAAGLLPPGAKFTGYPMDGGHHANRSPITEWLLQSGKFEQVWDGKGHLPRSQFGDLLCMRIGRTVWHVSSTLDYPNFLGIYEGVPAFVRQLDDSTWGRRVLAIWRPVE